MIAQKMKRVGGILKEINSLSMFVVTDCFHESLKFASYLDIMEEMDPGFRAMRTSLRNPGRDSFCRMPNDDDMLGRRRRSRRKHFLMFALTIGMIYTLRSW